MVWQYTSGEMDFVHPVAVTHRWGNTLPGHQEARRAGEQGGGMLGLLVSTFMRGALVSVSLCVCRCRCECVCDCEGVVGVSVERALGGRAHVAYEYISAMGSRSTGSSWVSSPLWPIHMVPIFAQSFGKRPHPALHPISTLIQPFPRGHAML